MLFICSITVRFFKIMVVTSRVFRFSILLLFAVGMAACGVDIPKETQSSFETMTVQKSDIEVPVKFSAKMKGQADVMIKMMIKIK